MINILIIESEKETQGEDRIDRFFSQNNLYQQDIDQVKIVTEKEAKLAETFEWVVNNRPLVITENKELLTYLTGRQSESIPYFLGALDLHIGQIQASDEVLSIKHLLSNFNQNQLSADQRQVFKILGELIR